MEKIKRRKRAIRGLACLLAGIVLGGAALCAWVASDPRFYSEERHLYRIQKRAERRFLREECDDTGLEVYPLYDENDEFKYALVEFEPRGFVCVLIDGFETPWSTMYSLSGDDSMTLESPYKAADIQNERRYFILLTDDSKGHRSTVGAIPAVKRGDYYIDLVSGREIPASTDFGDEAIWQAWETIDIFFPVGLYLWP